MTKIRTRHVALILSVAAIAAAGCGSSSSSKTTAAPASTPATPSTPSTTATTAVPSAVKAQLATAVKPVLTAVDQLQSNPQTAKNPSTWTSLATTLTQTAKSVAAVPGIPAASQAQVKSFVSLLNQAAGLANKVANDLKNNDQAAAKADVQKFQQIGHQISAL